MGEDRESGSGMFRAERGKGLSGYRFYAGSVLVGIVLIWFYRVSHFPASCGEVRWWVWLGMLGSEVWFGFYWFITQAVRWKPIYYFPHKDKLPQRNKTPLPRVDIFVCTADPVAEPPTLVISTVLSVLAYDYPTDKVSVYLSDDAGSILTYYALWEASLFAKHWLPYCRQFRVEPRSPAAYFSLTCSNGYTSSFDEWQSMKKLFDEMTERVERVIAAGKIPEKVSEQKGFCKWNSKMSSRNHPSIVQILIDGADQSSLDSNGVLLPTLVYVAREKSPEHHHNFKAGAMNALIRVSSEISNGPIILNIDCDMYSNNSESIKEALCFFLDESSSHDIAFVQYPQSFVNLTKNDLYACSLNVINETEAPGFNGLEGPMYVGTGCFHRRESLCGRKYSKEYREDWMRETDQSTKEEKIGNLEERTEALITCTYEYNTLWGKEMGLKYGCPVEDVITGLSIQCRGWRSIFHSPSRRAFLGIAPTTLEQVLVQNRRWAEGMFLIFASKHNPFIQGYRKLKLEFQLACCIFFLWAPNSFPTFYYITVPPLCLIKDISLFPEVSKLWCIPFIYTILATTAYSLAESLRSGDTLFGWWNSQRMWVLKRLTSYLYATIDVALNLLGFSKLSFAITPKSTDNAGVFTRYQQELMEFGSSSSSMFVIIATIAMLNLVCLVAGLWSNRAQFWMQILLCGVVVFVNLPIYGGLFFRRDEGRLPVKVTLVSVCLVLVACVM